VAFSGGEDAIQLAVLALHKAIALRAPITDDDVGGELAEEVKLVSQAVVRVEVRRIGAEGKREMRACLYRRNSITIVVWQRSKSRRFQQGAVSVG